MKNKISKLDHLNFTVSNLQESLEWYERVFNFKSVEAGIDRHSNKWAIIKSGDTMLALTEFPEKKIYEGEEFHKSYHFGLRLIDVNEWKETIEKNNLDTLYSSPIHYPSSSSWYVKDPTGNEIEVAIWKNNEVKFLKESN